MTHPSEFNLAASELDAILPSGRWVDAAEPAAGGEMEFSTIDRDEILAAVKAGKRIVKKSGPEATARGFGVMLIEPGEPQKRLYLATTRHAAIPALMRVSVPMEDRLAWYDAAKAAGQSLEDWVTDKLNAAADRSEKAASE